MSLNVKLDSQLSTHKMSQKFRMNYKKIESPRTNFRRGYFIKVFSVAPKLESG